MVSWIPQNYWIKALRGWSITDCAVRTSTIIYLVARKNMPEEEESLSWDHDIPTRLLAIYLHREPEKALGWQGIEGFNKPRCGVSRKPVSQGLLVARNNDGEVWAMGGGREGAMESIAPGEVPMTWRVKCIGGYAYSVGGRRSIYKRVAIGKWVKFAELPQGDGNVALFGFNDLDAFSETDMYAVGGHGDVWHFDGKTWVQQGFPSNVQLATVTCAGDGHVYISGEGGSLWRGQGSTWEPIYRGGSSIMWNDVLWFEDKLWLASDYQARIWNGKTLEPITHKGQEVPIRGHMDAYDGLLVIAGPEVVKAYDGKTWRTLIAPYLD